LARVVSMILERGHYLRQPLDDEISSKFLDRYLDSLETNRRAVAAYTRFGFRPLQMVTRLKVAVRDAAPAGDALRRTCDHGPARRCRTAPPCRPLR